jgi:hypothetical protein
MCWPDSAGADQEQMSQNELKLRRGFQALVEVLSNSGRKSDQKASLVLPYQRDPGVCQNVQHAFKWGCSDACDSPGFLPRIIKGSNVIQRVGRNQLKLFSRAEDGAFRNLSPLSHFRSDLGEKIPRFFGVTSSFPF